MTRARRAVSALAIALLGVACASVAKTPAHAPAQWASHSAASASSTAAAAPLPTLLLPGVGMSSKKPSPDPDPEDEPAGPVPACAKDEDCWSKTCCPAKAAEDCVHASRARKCAIVDIRCNPTPIHYTCICDEGSCRGRLAPP